MNNALRNAVHRISKRPALDDCKGKKETMDSAAGSTASAEDYTLKNISLNAAATIHQWCEDDDLDEGESSADRLLNSLIGIADPNKDGEITSDEQELLDVALNAAWDYLASKGVSEEDCDALLNDWDEDAADRVKDLVCSMLPEGEDAAMEDLNGFVFGEDAEQPALDAIYKPKWVVRAGKKMKKMVRVAGRVLLSAKQKLAVRKMHMKSHSASAMMHRARSFFKRRKMGL